MIRYGDAPLSGRTALVTGAGRNSGKAIALALARAGADVAVNAKSNREQADSTVAEIHALGRSSIPILGDVASRDDIKRMVDETRTSLGPITILVCSAAERSLTFFGDLTDEEWERGLHTSLSGTYYLAKAVVNDMMAAEYGRIVALSGARAHVYGHAHIAAAKAGVEGLVRGLAVDLGEFGITANAIGVGNVKTDRSNRPPAEQERIARAIEQANKEGHMVETFTTDELAELAVFLCLPEGRLISGQIIAADGGASLR